MKRETIEVITGKMISARDEVRPNLCQRFPAQMWQMNGGRGGIRAQNHHFYEVRISHFTIYSSTIRHYFAKFLANRQRHHFWQFY
jgi:hypothetical protein